MPSLHQPRDRSTKLLNWIARISATATAGLLLLMLVTESGTGPSGVREWAYLAFFPVGFGAAYLLGWWKPLLGGALSIACMLLSLLVIGRTYHAGAYVIWAVLCLPGLLYLWVGSRARRSP